MCEYIIEVENLELKSGEKYLLKDINWHVQKGEHWVVFGMNGSGKTTLLSILAGYKHNSSGKVHIFGQAFTETNILESRKRIGWISASFFDQIYKNESVINIVLSGKFGATGLDTGLTDEDYKLAIELLRNLGMREKAELPFKYLSKGERQNVLIARAFMGEPEILLLDEPCSGLDIVARECFMQTVSKLAKEGNVTIIYVTHYTEEIMNDIFQKTMLLRDGLCYMQGETAELFCADVLSNFLRCNVEVVPNKPYGFKINLNAIDK